MVLAGIAMLLLALAAIGMVLAAAGLDDRDDRAIRDTREVRDRTLVRS